MHACTCEDDPFSFLIGFYCIPCPPTTSLHSNPFLSLSLVHRSIGLFYFYVGFVTIGNDTNYTQPVDIAALAQISMGGFYCLMVSLAMLTTDYEFYYLTLPIVSSILFVVFS